MTSSEPATSATYQFVLRSLLTAVIILAAAVSAAFLFGFQESAISIAAGSVVAMASFAVLALVIVRTFAGGRGASWIAALGMLKVVVIGVVLWLLFRTGTVEPLAFSAGFSTMVAALVIDGIRRTKT